MPGPDGFDNVDNLPPIEIDEGQPITKVDATKSPDIDNLLKKLESGAQ